MATGDPALRPPGKRPLPSDPLLGAGASHWQWSFVHSQGTFPFGATARVGPIAWNELAQKVEPAIEAGGFGISFKQPPRYAPDPWGVSRLQPGFGCFVGEAQLVRLPHNTWLTCATYSSVVVSVTLEVDPPPAGKALGAADEAVIWKVIAVLGAVESWDGAQKGLGDVRRFTKHLPTDPDLGWIPSAIVSSLQ